MRRPTLPRLLGTTLAGTLVAGLLAAVSVTGATSPAAARAANPVTPGTFTGYAFDQCNTVTESAMRTWRRHSPFRGVGVYISGDSRACKTQANLTPTWVANQLADGWKILPITLGPQASCSTRFPRYGRSIDPTINPSTTNGYAAAKAQGAAEARDAVAAAKRLGIVPGSTLYYDLEAWDVRRSTACTQSALWFTHAWTVELHRLGYASGFYSSAASGIKVLDDERVRSGSTVRQPDQVWIADWDGGANTTSTYVRSDGWANARVKQYRGDHNETHGGVTINIDSNYLSLRTPRLPGAAPAPTPTPTPTPTPAPAPSAPRYTGSNMSDAKCSPATINRTTYRRTGPKAGSTSIVALQCLLKQQRHYPYEVTGTWNTQTRTAVRAFQDVADLPQGEAATRATWVALLVKGNAATALRVGSTGADATRLQRALNAATTGGATVSGTWRSSDVTRLRTYQRQVGLTVTGRPTSATWKALSAGRW